MSKDLASFALCGDHRLNPLLPAQETVLLQARRARLFHMALSNSQKISLQYWPLLERHQGTKQHSGRQHSSLSLVGDLLIFNVLHKNI